MDRKIQVILNTEENIQFEDIRKHYENIFGIKLNNSMLLRFMIQKEWNFENGIEFNVSKI